MGTYYRIYKDVDNEKFQAQYDARNQLAELIKTPIKYDIYPTIVASDVDKDIEAILYNHRNDYTCSSFHKGDYTYRGYGAVAQYQRLYTRIFELNSAVWEVPPIELATAYLELLKEYTLFEQWNNFTYDIHIDVSNDWGTKARLVARKCGIDMTSGLQIANRSGFIGAIRDYTGGAYSYFDKSYFEQFAKSISKELELGETAFTRNNPVTISDRDKLPCMYTMLNLFCGMYRDIFWYRNDKQTVGTLEPQLTKATGFDERKYKQNGGENYEMGMKLFVGSIIMFFVFAIFCPDAIDFLFVCLVINIVIAMVNIYIGRNSQ